MGPYASRRWLEVAAWFFSAFVITLNVWAIGDMVVSLMKTSTLALALTVVFIFPACLGLIGLLVYMTFVWKKVDNNNEFAYDNTGLLSEVDLEEYASSKPSQDSSMLPQDTQNDDEEPTTGSSIIV